MHHRNALVCVEIALIQICVIGVHIFNRNKEKQSNWKKLSATWSFGWTAAMAKHKDYA